MGKGITAWVLYRLIDSAFGTLTMLRNLNAGGLSGAADQFAQQSYEDGQALAGLARRLAAEAALFLPG